VTESHRLPDSPLRAPEEKATAAEQLLQHAECYYIRDEYAVLSALPYAFFHRLDPSASRRGSANS